MQQFVIEVRVLVPVEARSVDAAERIAAAKISDALQGAKDVSVSGTRAIDRARA